MIKIIKNCYSNKLKRKLEIGEKIDFGKEANEILIENEFAEKVVTKQTKERKRTIKKK